jgi:hypothetical protein
VLGVLLMAAWLLARQPALPALSAAPL